MSDKITPRAPIYDRNGKFVGLASTENGLALARSMGLRIFEPRLNYSAEEYNKIVKRNEYTLKKYKFF